MLDSYSKNKYYSQFGEDGIVEEIFQRLENNIELDEWCSEFGAWDGVHLSNTCHFIRNKQYKAVLIEGDPSRVSDLKKNFPQEEVHKVQKFVSFEGPNSLDSIFSEYEIPINFDFLSIDIDGVDYHIFESLKKYHPKVICIEFNPTIPNAVEYVQPKDMKIKHGNSAKAIVRLGHTKGYKLVAITKCNLILVDEKLANFVIESEPSLESLHEIGNLPTYIFCGYDGSILSNKEHLVLVWHTIPVPISKLQFLPRFLRKYSGDYGYLRRLALIVYVGMRIPKTILKYRQTAVMRLKSELKTIFRF
jgi:hypothetical protein